MTVSRSDIHAIAYGIVDSNYYGKSKVDAVAALREVAETWTPPADVVTVTGGPTLVNNTSANLAAKLRKVGHEISLHYATDKGDDWRSAIKEAANALDPDSSWDQMSQDELAKECLRKGWEWRATPLIANARLTGYRVSWMVYGSATHSGTGATIQIALLDAMKNRKNKTSS